VVGPDRCDGVCPWREVAIGDLLFPNEPESSVNREDFESNILTKMKAGESDRVKFRRTSTDGTTEILELAFRPVTSRVLLPLDPSDFSRGAIPSNVLVYSVGVVYQESQVVLPWSMIEGEIEDDLEDLQAIFLSIVAVVSLLYIILTFYVAVKICKPMLVLLCIVQSINKGNIEDDIPPLHGGSSETNQVYNCFAKLYKIVRVSNGAFFSGNLGFAYRYVPNYHTEVSFSH